MKSNEWNRETFGQCNHSNWHGHNYVIKVTVAGEPDPETGYVIDLGELKKVIRERVISKCDHKNLNLDVDFLSGVIPSTENLAKFFFRELSDDVNKLAYNGSLYSVTLYETERNFAEYREA